MNCRRKRRSCNATMKAILPMPRFSTFRTRAGLVCACCAALLLAAPTHLFASQLGTDIVCGTAESERQDDASDIPDIEARNAIVMGQDGTVYYERAADEQTKIASITKVMTAIIALENASLDDTVTVDHAAATVGQSTAELKEGDTLTLEAALRGLLIPSGNDAAMAIATTVGAKIDPSSSDPYSTFIDAMNKKAQELGLGSVYTNPSGLDFDGWEADMHSSARDVAKTFAYAMKIPEFRTLTSSDNNVITITGADGTKRDITMIERNLLLGKDGNIGGKTGGTYEALQCFVGGFSRETGGEIYTVVLGCETGEQRFADTQTLANWYYNHVVSYPAVTSNQIAADGSPLVARATDGAWSDKTIDVTAKDPSQTVQVFSLAGDVKQKADLVEFSGDVSAGDDAGTITLTQGKHKIATVALVAAQDQAAPNPFEWLLVQLDRLARLITGRPTQAKSSVVNTVPAPTELDAA